MRLLPGALLVSMACANTPGPPLPAAVARTGAQALAIRDAHRPEHYKMVHQVVARYEGNTYAMTGYMLGRRDGSFRVSAFADIGPPLFDVAKVDGVFTSQVHFAPLAARLDPVHIARAIDRIFIAECGVDGSDPAAPPASSPFVFQCPLTGDDEADSLRMEVDRQTLAVVQKVFSRGGRETLHVSYEEAKPFGAEWMPTRIHLKAMHGYSLDLAVTAYEPGFSFEDARLRVP
jgi:hypothetical protein